MNSSLFEPTEMEHEGLFISQLRDTHLRIINSTVLRDQTGKKRSGSLATLEYIFAFLDAYDFGGDGAEEIQEDNKTLINASVLGLIFEKINGYKDGSFFTPGFITMYMCRETIRRAVVQKFNEVKKWNCQDIIQIHNKIGDEQEANAIINSLKICDPAVGSGHFLVSALNEIISIKHDLKILIDREGKLLKHYNVEVVSDELIVTDEDGKIFEYNPRNKESQRVQEALFHEKQTIIENCLFGVDINPNSVKICRLRLWIELLKNAYYKAPAFTELETLPNIDINIKCGNSLISRYPLDADIKEALRKSKWSIDSYRLAVMTYRNAENKEQKQAMVKLIEQIKSDFESEVKFYDRRIIRLTNAKDELKTHVQQTPMFELSKKQKSDWEKKLKKLTAEIKKLETELEEEKNNIIYENAFEWRFEFPEVLNDYGNFVGFDIVIGNPPYIKARDYENRDFRRAIESSYESAIKMWDIYIPFIEQAIRILNQAGRMTYIIPDTIGLADYTKKIVEIIESRHQLSQIDFYPNQFLFDDVGVKNKIIFLNKTNDDKCTKRILHVPNPTDVIILPDVLSAKKYLPETSNFVFPEENTMALSEICFVSYGLRLNSDKNDKEFKFQKKDLVSDVETLINNRLYTEGKHIDRYVIKRKLYVEWGTDRCPTKLVRPTFPELYDPEKLLFSRQKRIAAYSNEKLICDNTIIMAILAKDLRNIENTNIRKYFVNLETDRKTIEDNSEHFDLKYILAVINSNLVAHFIKFNNKGNIDFYPDDWKKIPIKKISSEEQKPFINLVTQILDTKNQDVYADTSALEKEVDELVYQLYGLTAEEIQIVEQAVS